MHKPGTYIGFDFGTKRIGIAVGQTLTLTASPLITLKNQEGAPPWMQIDKIISEWQPCGLVVGLALQTDGSASIMSTAALGFGQSLKDRYQLPVYYIEERLTSVEAAARLKESPPFVRHHRDKDAMAAAIILESWFQSKKESTHAFFDPI